MIIDLKPTPDTDKPVSTHRTSDRGTPTEPDQSLAASATSQSMRVPFGLQRIAEIDASLKILNRNFNAAAEQSGATIVDLAIEMSDLRAERRQLASQPEIREHFEITDVLERMKQDLKPAAAILAKLTLQGTVPDGDYAGGSINLGGIPENDQEALLSQLPSSRQAIRSLLSQALKVSERYIDAAGQQRSTAEASLDVIASMIAEESYPILAKQGWEVIFQAADTSRIPAGLDGINALLNLDKEALSNLIRVSTRRLGGRRVAQVLRERERFRGAWNGIHNS